MCRGIEGKVVGLGCGRGVHGRRGWGRFEPVIGFKQTVREPAPKGQGRKDRGGVCGYVLV